MFKKRKHTECEEPETKRGLTDFEEFEGSDRSHPATDLYAPDSYLITKEYGIPSVLLNFEANYDHMLQEFFSRANPDEFNTSFIDATLACLEAEALASLELQRHEHQLNETPYALMAWKRGKADYMGMKKQAELELAEVEKDITKYKEILHRGTSLEEHT